MSQEPSAPLPVLVPIDFSPSSRAALLWAAQTAERFAAPLEILHVVHDPASAPGYYKKENGELQSLEDAARDMMEAFLGKVVQRHPELPLLPTARQILVVGLPVDRILEIAERRRAQLIVMGSQGRTGLPKLLLGSKAQRVVQLASIPVTIVKAPRAEVEEGDS